MIVRDLAPAEIQRRLAAGSLRLRTGPVVTAIRSTEPAVAAGIGLLYQHHPVESDETFADFHVSVRRPVGLRRWVRPQVQFASDALTPFLPLPADQAMPMLEWGLNWCVSSHYHRFLIVHAAALERHGRALVLPAPPGSGKSTLTAALVHRGWRLLSDELALIDPRTLEVRGLARPVSLKNASIGIIRRFAPLAIVSEPVHDTTKGSVAHMAPPSDSVARAHAPARPGWVVLPRYESAAGSILAPLSKGRLMMDLADNAFNYTAHGRAGFEALGALVEASGCFEYVYSDLDQAMKVFDQLASAP